MFDTRDDDNYETPYEAFDKILFYVRNDRTIYEPFYCSGRSGEYIRGKGYNVIHYQRDFFSDAPLEPFDLIVSNPPYSIRPAVFRHLHEIGKPWALLVPLTTLSAQYFQKYFSDGERLQLVLFNKRVQFLKDGIPINRCNFDCAWLCWDMHLPKSICF